MTQLQRVTGTPQQWGRDMAYIGGVTSLVCTGMGMAFGVTPFYVLAATAAGALTGGLLGAAMPALLDQMRGRMPLALLVLAAGPLGGAVWGGTVGALAWMLAGGAPEMAHYSVGISIAIAAIAGALQFGLSWFPYTFQTVRSGARWPVLLASTLITPLVGFAAVISAIALFA